MVSIDLYYFPVASWEINECIYGSFCASITLSPRPAASFPFSEYSAEM